jgi:hypothetical protein
MLKQLDQKRNKKEYESKSKKIGGLIMGCKGGSKKGGKGKPGKTGK